MVPRAETPGVYRSTDVDSTRSLLSPTPINVKRPFSRLGSSSDPQAIEIEIQVSSSLSISQVQCKFSATKLTDYLLEGPSN